MSELDALIDPDCCDACQDDYGRDRLTDGICDSCRHEAAGLCPCGNDPVPGYRLCPACSADEEADWRFHAAVEEGEI